MVHLLIQAAAVLVLHLDLVPVQDCLADAPVLKPFKELRRQLLQLAAQDRCLCFGFRSLQQSCWQHTAHQSVADAVSSEWHNRGRPLKQPLLPMQLHEPYSFTRSFSIYLVWSWPVVPSRPSYHDWLPRPTSACSSAYQLLHPLLLLCQACCQRLQRLLLLLWWCWPLGGLVAGCYCLEPPLVGCIDRPLVGGLPEDGHTTCVTTARPVAAPHYGRRFACGICFRGDSKAQLSLGAVATHWADQAAGTASFKLPRVPIILLHHCLPKVLQQS